MSNGGGHFAFAVPFKSRASSTDWDLAVRNLQRTLESASAAAQGHPVSFYVACHEEPPLSNPGGLDLKVLSVPFPEPSDVKHGNRDKASKRRFIGAHLREVLDVPEIFVMFLDADDLVHRDVVRHVLDHGHGSYVIDDGYILDIQRRALRRRAHNFYRTCGSSFVCRFNGDELPKSWDDMDAPFSQFGVKPQRNHDEYPTLAAELGRPAATFPFPAAVYTVNHSESLWRAKTGGNVRNLRYSSELVRPGTARRTLAEVFSAPDLSEQLAGIGGVAAWTMGLPWSVMQARVRHRRAMKNRSEHENSH